MGLDLTLQRRGFYPAGGGRVEAAITPASQPLVPFDLPARDAEQHAWAESYAPGLCRSIAPRELEALGRALGWNEAQLRAPPVRQNEGPGNALLATLAHWKINPRRWLTWYLESCAVAGGKTPKDIQPYLPWNLSDERRLALGASATVPVAHNTS